MSHSEQPYMNETPCQHGNYACPLCDAVPSPGSNAPDSAMSETPRLIRAECGPCGADLFLVYFIEGSLVLECQGCGLRELANFPGLFRNP